MAEYSLFGYVLSIVFIILVVVLVILFASILRNIFTYEECENYLYNKERKRDIRNNILFRIMLFLFVFILSFVVHYLVTNIEDKREELFRIEYTGFYNGEVIDLENVDFDEYDMKYDIEKKEVYLSEKTEYRYIFIPFRFY